MTCNQSKNIQKMLEEVLEELKRLFRMGYELKVVWLPDSSSSLCGEVKNGTLYVYEKEREEALETLLHEFFDYALSKVIEPYRDLLNQIIKAVNMQVYKRKELLVESFLEFLKPHISRKNQIV